MPRLLRCTAALVAALLPAMLWGQAPLTLGRLDAEFKTAFTRIAAVRELKDGRVLVIDARERNVQVIDFKSATATRVGRVGTGPGEYTLPQRIVALPGDTSAIYDPANLRYLLIGPDGKVGPTFSLEETLSGGRGRPGGTAPRGSDARGRFFFEGLPFATTADGGIVPADSAPIMRYDRATKKLDTVAYVQLAKGNAQVSGRQGMVQMVVGRKPFPMRDDWAAMPDGGVAVVRVNDYHVDWYPAVGKPTSGTSLRIPRVPVTEADKVNWRAERQAVAASGLQEGRGGAPPTGRPMSTLPEPEFPAFKPPFAVGDVSSGPNGGLWVQRSRKATDNEAVYDVFHPTRMTAQVVFPPRTQLVGFGNNVVYVMRIDNDDLQYLQRYRTPSFR